VGDIRYNPDTIHRWFPGMADVAKPVFIQAFIAKASVKTLKKSGSVSVYRAE